MKEKQAEDIRSQDEKHSLIVDDPGVNADTELTVRKESTFRLF